MATGRGGWPPLQVWALTAPPGGHCCPAAGLQCPGKERSLKHWVQEFLLVESFQVEYSFWPPG